MEALSACGSIDTEMEVVSSEMEVTAGLIQRLVDEYATRKLGQHDYRKKYGGYASQYAAPESQMDRMEKEWERKEIQYDIFSGFLSGLKEVQELPMDFNERLFHRLVDYATVYSDGKVAFTFRNGGSQHGDLKVAGRFRGIPDFLPIVFACVNGKDGGQSGNLQRIGV